jgi:hypothetical protein
MDSAEFFPKGIPVHEVGSVCRKLLEALGSRTHAWRTLWPICRAGDELLATGRFNMVLFSTATFLYFVLGPRWRHRYGVPYVLDFHDPWVKKLGASSSNGSRFRSWVLVGASKWLERNAVVNAAGLVSVSPHYIWVLRERYKPARPPWLESKRNAVIPFGALERDFTEVRRSVGASNAHPGIIVAYVGAGGAIMARGFTLLCRALAALRNQRNQLVDQVRFELRGTTYGWREGDRKVLAEVAGESGVGDLVNELPRRVSYRQSLTALVQADGALVLGVDDIGYMPSKLFNYALSGKPLLASLRRESPAYAEFERNPTLGHALWFSGECEMPLAEAVREVSDFLGEAAARKNFDRRSILKPFLAPAMATQHATLFDNILLQSSVA